VTEVFVLLAEHQREFNSVDVFMLFRIECGLISSAFYCLFEYLREWLHKLPAEYFVSENIFVNKMENY